MLDPIGAGNRPDTMFLQTQYMPWEAHPVRGAGASRRRLSQHPTNGSETFVLRLSPGYRAGPAFLGSDFEFYVVNGAMVVNGITYRPHCFGMHPAGYMHHAVESAEGCTVIAITTGGPDELLKQPRFRFRQERLALYTDVTQIPWPIGIPPQLGGSRPRPKPAPLTTEVPEAVIFNKVIWQDPDTKGITFIKCDMPHVSRQPGTTRAHMMDAEYFILEGDYIIADEGRMLPGAYFCWGGGTPHGPSACEFMSTILTKYHSPVSLENYQTRVQISLDPKHNPPAAQAFPQFSKALPYPDPWS